MRLEWDAQVQSASMLYGGLMAGLAKLCGPKPISEGGVPGYEESVSVLLDEFDNVRVAPDLTVCHRRLFHRLP